jgi:hypothetical protein
MFRKAPRKDKRNASHDSRRLGHIRMQFRVLPPHVGLYQVVPSSSERGTFSTSGWRKWPPAMEGSCEYIVTCQRIARQ